MPVDIPSLSSQSERVKMDIHWLAGKTTLRVSFVVVRGFFSLGSICVDMLVGYIVMDMPSLNSQSERNTIHLFGTY